MTAIEKLISQLQNEISELEKKIEKYSHSKEVYVGHKYGLNHAIEIAESLLEMEQEQKIEFAKMHVKTALKAVENEMILQASSVKHWYLPQNIK